MYDLQKQQYTVQQKLSDNKKIPKVGVFVQGGYGRPALDFLSNKFDTYYITGIRLNWNLTSFYTIKREKDLLEISRKNIDVQKETFLFNTGVSLTQQTNEIEKYRQLVNTDNSIIQLRQKVKTAATAQLENGVITAIDYLSYVNAEDQARRAMALHSIQLLMAQYNYQNTTGN
jgi:outer membrane protein TolC